MKNILITICGRAGSKGFQNKNLKTFLDKPLVYYSLSPAFDFKNRITDANVDIILNTDSIDLINLIKDKYPEVIILNRKPEHANDTSPKMEVFQDSLMEMEISKNIKYDYLIDLDITSPLRQIDDVFNAYELKLKRSDAGVVLTGCPSRRNPFFNLVKDDGDKIVKSIDLGRFTARQEVPNTYDLNASIYVFEASFLRENKTGFIWDTKCVLSLMKDTGVLDIDSEEDFELMQLVGKYFFTEVESFKKIRDNIR